MNVQNEELKKYIDDAFFLEHTIYKISCRSVALEGVREEEQKRQEYDSKYEKNTKPTSVTISIIIFILIEATMAVLVLAILVASVLLSWIPGCDFLMMKDATVIKLLKIFLLIPPAFYIIKLIVSIISSVIDNKKKREFDAVEDERLKYVNEVVVPSIMTEEKKLEEECSLYEDALDRLYSLNVLPEDCRNFEYVYVMQQYINKYKITDKKQLLNACDKFFQHTDLQQDVNELSEHLDSVQLNLIQSFSNMVDEISYEIEGLISEIKAQNFKIQQIQQQSENEKQKIEILLYWKLTQ